MFIPVWFFQCSLYSCCSPASYHQHSPWLNSNFQCKKLLTEILYWDHSPEKFWMNNPCSIYIVPISLAPSLPIPSSCVCLVWKLLPQYQTWNTKRRGTSALFFIFAASTLMKQTQEAPWVRPGLIQTPLCWVNAILGTGLYPTATSYLGLTSHSKLYSSPLSLLSRENRLLSFN